MYNFRNLASECVSRCVYGVSNKKGSSRSFSGVPDVFSSHTEVQQLKEKAAIAQAVSLCFCQIISPDDLYGAGLACCREWGFCI